MTGTRLDVRPCPRCGGPRPVRHFACQPCWLLLPDEVREQLRDSIARMSEANSRHRVATGRAMKWWRDHRSELEAVDA